MALYLRYAVRSDLGLVRSNNEDSVYAGPRLLAIADGMGGHAAGEVASKIVIGTMEPLDEDRRIDDLMGALRDTVQAANRGIADAVRESKELEGMGTTLTALRFVGSKVGLVHVGDSRAYLLRNDELTQITHDDTYVQYLVDSGKLTPEEAKDHPRKSVILRALLGSEVEPDVSIREAHAGDRYMLCSDGLSDVVSSETIAETMRIEDPQEAADRLVELALRGGGPDNVTVVVADVINARVGDRIDDVPVIAGAFVDPAAADVPGSNADSAAERAAAMSRQSAQQAPKPAAEQAEAPIAHRRRRGRRPWLLILGALVLLAALLTGGYAWTQSQYFVGVDHKQVAIYQGVDTEIGPLKLFDVYRRTDLRVADLNPSVRSRVSSGITANSRGEAEAIVRDLRHQQLPLCTTPSPATPSPGPSTPSSPSPLPTASRPTASPRASARTSPRTLQRTRVTPSTSPRSVVGRIPVRTSGVVGRPLPSATSVISRASTSVSAGVPASGPGYPTGTGVAPSPSCRSGP